jgi:hypothetical protein
MSRYGERQRRKWERAGALATIDTVYGRRFLQGARVYVGGVYVGDARAFRYEPETYEPKDHSSILGEIETKVTPR